MALTDNEQHDEMTRSQSSGKRMASAIMDECGSAGAQGRVDPERRLLVALAFAAPTFYATANIETVLAIPRSWRRRGGMTLLIMAGAFDLSVTSTMGLAPIVAVSVAGNGSALSLVLVSVLTGVGLGVVNGLIVTRGRVAPFVATLGRCSSSGRSPRSSPGEMR